MREIRFNSMEHGEVIANGAGATFNPGYDTVISMVRDDKLIGGVVFYNYNTCSIWGHFSATNEHWLSRDMLWVCFHYPFVQLGVSRLFGCVQSTNQHALDFDRRLGFKEVTVVPKVYPDGDAVIMCMEREDCRFLKWQPRTLAANS